MNKIAIFGKPGGGKSTLSKKISAATDIPLHPLDSIEYQKNGERVSQNDYTVAHDELIQSESWIIDGLGKLDSFWSRIEAADTLIYIDLPYWQHYWWATKRLLLSPFIKPEGWPEGSSVLKGTLASWKYLRLSPEFWTTDFFASIQDVSKNKRVYHLTSVRELNEFITKQIREI